jgi:hypothetical protein
MIIQAKPTVQTNSKNVWTVWTLAVIMLNKYGLHEQVSAMSKRAFAQSNRALILEIIKEYVDVQDAD